LATAVGLLLIVTGFEVAKHYLFVPGNYLFRWLDLLRGVRLFCFGLSTAPPSSCSAMVSCGWSIKANCASPDGTRLAHIKCERSKAMRARTNVKAGTEANSEKIAR
jgi:hypothetical protein